MRTTTCDPRIASHLPARRPDRGRGSVAAFGVAALLATLFGAQRASAQAEDQAAARALFDEARRLMAAGQLEQACPKLEAASKLYAGSGVLLNLGDCYEKTQRTASAWTAFGEAAAAATRTARPDDEVEAKRRQGALEPRLSRLTVRVARETPGLVVKRDGKALDRAAWGLPIPVDPGVHALSAEAATRTAWSASVAVNEVGKTVTVEVPELAAAAVAPAPAAPAVVAVPAAPAAPIVADKPVVANPPAKSRALAYTLLVGGGAVGLGGGILALVETSKANAAADARDRGAYDSAKTMVIAGDVLAALGGVAAVTGVVLLVTGRKSPPASAVWRVGPWLGASAAGAQAGGTW